MRQTSPAGVMCEAQRERAVKRVWVRESRVSSCEGEGRGGDGVERRGEGMGWKGEGREGDVGGSQEEVRDKDMWIGVNDNRDRDTEKWWK